MNRNLVCCLSLSLHLAALIILVDGLANSTQGQHVDFVAPTIEVVPGETGFFDIAFELTGGPVDIVGWDFLLEIDPAIAPGVTFTSAEPAPDGLAFDNGSTTFLVEAGSVSANDIDGALNPVNVPDGSSKLLRIFYSAAIDVAVPSTFALNFGDDGLNNVTDSNLEALPDTELDGAINVIPEPSALALAAIGILAMARYRRSRQQGSA